MKDSTVSKSQIRGLIGVLIAASLIVVAPCVLPMFSTKTLIIGSILAINIIGALIIFHVLTKEYEMPILTRVKLTTISTLFTLIVSLGIYVYLHNSLLTILDAIFAIIISFGILDNKELHTSDWNTFIGVMVLVVPIPVNIFILFWHYMGITF